MDTARDLGQVDPWRESLERSLARRGTLTRPSPGPDQLQPQRGLAQDGFVRRPTNSWQSPGRPSAKRLRMLVLSAGGIFTLALLAATLPSLFNGPGASAGKEPVAFSARGQASARAGDASASHGAAGSSHAGSSHAAAGSGGAVSGAVATRRRICRPSVQSNGYVNPLARARVIPERIDQGVDYAGSGMLTALGAAKVTYVATSGTGWPGAFIEYRLSGGANRGCYVYYAEGVNPASGLRVGETVRAGHPIAAIIPGYSSGIEIGWGTHIATNTYAAKMGQWSPRDDADNIPTAAGKSFSALIASLGGPPGKNEG